jgi:ATP/maltotriose-dependent transcriptional regulator MalT
LAICKAIGDEQGILWGQAAVAEDMCFLGDMESARPIFEECLSMAIKLNKIWEVAGNKRVLGDIAFAWGDYERALTFYAESNEIQTRFGHWETVIGLQRAMGQVLLAKGECTQSFAHCWESVRIAREKGWSHGVVAGLVTLAGIARAQGQVLLAAQLLGFVSMQIEAHKTKLTTRNCVYEPAQTDYDESIAALRQSLSPVEFADAWAAGRAITLEQAISKARAVSVAPEEVHGQTSGKDLPATTNSAGLSAREVEVLRLLAHGLTNPQIAETLVISTRTVNAHLRSIYGKLDVTTRTAAARIAIEHKLS